VDLVWAVIRGYEVRRIPELEHGSGAKIPGPEQQQLHLGEDHKRTEADDDHDVLSNSTPSHLKAHGIVCRTYEYFS
jgi:hypothetical protein